MRKNRLCVVALLFMVTSTTSFARQDDERLAPLFTALSTTESSMNAREIELSIWQIWTDAGRDDVNELMSHGMAALQYRQYEVALESFSRVIDLNPEFAEGWNKRATVHWLMNNFSDSMDDIRRTLALEPRHFGAISGMGLIFLERGDEQGALQAFEAVLEISPGSQGAQQRVEQLRSKIQGDAV